MTAPLSLRPSKPQDARGDNPGQQPETAHDTKRQPHRPPTIGTLPGLDDARHEKQAISDRGHVERQAKPFASFPDEERQDQNGRGGQRKFHCCELNSARFKSFPASTPLGSSTVEFAKYGKSYVVRSPALLPGTGSKRQVSGFRRAAD